eukprot:1160628-Pelagomonas_calceolata.AAC.12
MNHYPTFIWRFVMPSGVVYGKNGCTLFALRQEVDTVTVEKGLTVDGLLCQINALGIAPPILFHQSFEDPEVRVRDYRNQDVEIKVGKNCSSASRPKGGMAFQNELVKSFGFDFLFPF